MTHMAGSMNTNSNNNNSGGSDCQEDGFVEVWEKNMDEQFDRIRQLVQKYPYVAMVSVGLAGGPRPMRALCLIRTQSSLVW